jgi:hypothetical protein
MGRATFWAIFSPTHLVTLPTEQKEDLGSASNDV